MNITFNQLECLITCPKVITTAPHKKFDVENGNRKNDFRLESENGEHRFSVFMRQNTILTENFSIGLKWETAPTEDSIILLRCNGPHGGNKKYTIHFVPHIHRLNIELAQQDIFKENDVRPTDEYSTFDSALFYFCNLCNIKDADKYFLNAFSPALFDV